MISTSLPKKIEVVIPKSVFVTIMLLIVLASALSMFYEYWRGKPLLPADKSIFFGVCAALLAGIPGYINNLIKPEDFDPVKFLLTVVFCIFAGFIMHKSGLSYNEAVSFAGNFLAQTGFGVAIERWVKAIAVLIKIRWT